MSVQSKTSIHEYHKEADLVRAEPLIFGVELIHVAVEVVQVAIFQLGVINKVPLTACVVITVIVSLTWKVQPFRVTKLVTCTAIIMFTHLPKV